MARLPPSFWDGRLNDMQLFRSDSAPKDIHRQRPWAVTAIGRLMLLEGLGLLFLAWYLAPDTARPTVSEIWLALTLAVLGLFALISSLRFLRLRRKARDRAMLLQGATLSLALFLYFDQGPGFIYGMMVYAIFLVLYLQHPDVLACFPDEVPGMEGGSPR